MKYTLYAWCADDEGGYAICNCGEFTPNRNYHPESGWRAKPSVKIGDFDTVRELAELLYNDSPAYWDSVDYAMIEATEMMQRRKAWEEYRDSFL